VDVPDFLQNASSRSVDRPVDPDAFGIDVSPVADEHIDDRFDEQLDGRRADRPAADAVERRIVDGGNGGRRLLEDVLAAALADEAPRAPAAAQHEVELEPPTDELMDVPMDDPMDASIDRATDELFAGIVDYEPFDAVPATAPLAAPVPVDRADPPALPAPIDPLRRPTELATIAAGRLATRLAELPRAGGVQAECYRVSVAVTTPDGTRIEMSTEVDGAGD
jgi:hypothetical protein